MSSNGFGQILQTYIDDLQQVCDQLSTSSRNNSIEIQVLKQKIQMQIIMYRRQMNSAKTKENNQFHMDRLNKYLTSSFNEIVKESYRLIHLGRLLPNKQSQMSKQNGEFLIGNDQQLKMKSKLQLLKQAEREMAEEWEKDNSEKHKQHNKICNVKDLTMLGPQVRNDQIRGLAKQYLLKEFLAIRMISYKLYQKYIGHGHSKAYERIESLKYEQERIAHEIRELNDNNKTLKMDEKRLMRDLGQIKKINELISKRYFDTEESIQS